MWTYDARKREGQLPLLPPHSSVVFDEGHLLETAAQNALTYKLNHFQFESIITRLLHGEVRETLAYTIEEAIGQSEALFNLLDRIGRKVIGSERKEFAVNEELLREVKRFRELIGRVEEELVFESAAFTLEDYQLKIVEEHLEMIQLALGLFDQPGRLISWVTADKDGTTLVMMPKKVKEVLQEKVFSQRMPIVFSSATLSVDGSFDYIARSLGIESYLSFSVPSPYDYSEQMKVNMIPDGSVSGKMKQALRLLRETDGRSLLLFPSQEELAQFRKDIALFPEFGSFRIFYEGSAEISHLISAFQNDEASNMCAVTL